MLVIFQLLYVQVLLYRALILRWFLGDFNGYED